MRKKKLKRDYERPECKVHLIESNEPICTSVYHEVQRSCEPNNNRENAEYYSPDRTKWDFDDINAGTIEF